MARDLTSKETFALSSQISRELTQAVAELNQDYTHEAFQDVYSLKVIAENLRNNLCFRLAMDAKRLRR